MEKQETRPVRLESVKDGSYVETWESKVKVKLLYKTISAAYVEKIEPKEIEIDGETKIIYSRRNIQWSLGTMVRVL